MTIKLIMVAGEAAVARRHDFYFSSGLQFIFDLIMSPFLTRSYVYCCSLGLRTIADNLLWIYLELSAILVYIYNKQAVS